MATDWMYAEPIGLYVIVETNGREVKTLDMTREKPVFRPARTACSAPRTWSSPTH